MTEHTFDVAKLADGEMMRVEIEQKPVVLTRVDGKIIAFGGKCSHYDAPLEKGVLHGYTIMCPWHHSCFDIRTGERLEPPGLNDIPSYEVREENGRATIAFPHTNATQPQGRAAPNAEQTFIIVGGGAAGESAAEELRREGFTGRIIMISNVPETPVDRPNLSKDYLDGHAKPEWMPLRSEKWYADRDIDLQRNTNVIGIDAKTHTVRLDTEVVLTYDKLLLATGGKPRKLDLPGFDLEGVFTLRTMADSNTIIEAAEEGKRAAVIGGSFIGMEVAASLQGGRGVSVTVIERSEVPFAPVLGERIGRALQKRHEENGVQFRLGANIEKLTGENGKVTGVQLKGGEVIPADFVVVGVGVEPVTDYVALSGLEMFEKDQSVRVNAQLQTSDPDIYAAGDIARWDDGSKTGTRVEHWRLAQQHGMVAARNMLGQTEDFNRHIPFFWTNQWKFNLRYVGHATEWDEIIYRGEPESADFIAFFVAKGKLLAAVGAKHDPDMDAIEFMMRDGIKLTPEQMRDEKYDLVKAIKD